MNRRRAPFTPVDLTVGSSAQSNVWPIIFEAGTVTGPRLSTVRPDKE